VIGMTGKSTRVGSTVSVRASARAACMMGST
jgi:hypothetical protein